MSKKKLLILSFLIMLLPGITSSGIHAQGGKAKYEKVINGQSLTSVLKQLEEKFSTKIVFSYEDLGTYKVKARVNADDIEEALKQVLKNLPVTYSSNGNIYTERRTLTECIFKGMTMRFLHRHIRSELHKPVIPKRMCTVCLGCNAVTTSYHKGKDQCSNFCISHKINIISLFRLQNYNFFSYLPNISLFF